jgi:hypothetical protein
VCEKYEECVRVCAAHDFAWSVRECKAYVHMRSRACDARALSQSYALWTQHQQLKSAIACSAEVGAIVKVLEF